MNLVTWNVNRFDGTWDRRRNGCDIEEKERKKYLELIIKKIKKYVKEENDVAFLQEVPLNQIAYIQKSFEDKELLIKDKKLLIKSWHIEENPYIISKEDSKKLNYNAWNLTVAIVTENSNWELVPFQERNVNYGVAGNEKYNYINRYVELRNSVSEEKIFGGHFEMYDKNDDKKMWEPFENEIQFTYILGDFNLTAEKWEEEDGHNIYDVLENKGYKRLIDSDIITNNVCATSIDNIFVSSKAWKNKSFNTKVIDYCKVTDKNYNIRYSDHNICITSIKQSDTDQKD